jgi:hypothetical protein
LTLPLRVVDPTSTYGICQDCIRSLNGHRRGGTGPTLLSLYGEYPPLWRSFAATVSDLSETERAMLFRDTARHYYRLGAKPERAPMRNFLFDRASNCSQLLEQQP